MSDAIVVLNAGSSSIKFSLFVVGAADLTVEVRGQIEGLFTAPHFLARDAGGRAVAEKSWPKNKRLGHEEAVDHLVHFLEEELAEQRLVGIGHRVAHGGLDYPAPVRVDGRVLKDLERFVPLAPLHQPHNLSPIALLLDRLPDVPLVHHEGSQGIALNVLGCSHPSTIRCSASVRRAWRPRAVRGGRASVASAPGSSNVLDLLPSDLGINDAR